MWAQYGRDYKSLGDRAFNNKDYYEAAAYYQKQAEGMHLVKTTQIPFQSTDKKLKNTKPSDATYVSYRLAESYRLYENYVLAEPWYYKVLNQNGDANYPLTRLWYGVCLRANQNFDEAIKQLQLFKTTFKGNGQYVAIANKEIANCNFAKDQYKYPGLFTINKMKGDWNSDGSDYSLIRKDGNYFFTSSRLIKDDKKHLNRIYQADAANSFKPVMIDLKITDKDKKKELEYGTPSVTGNGKRIYFTLWYKDGAKGYYDIYRSEWQATNEWSTPVKMGANINADGFNAIQPFVTPDGKRLFFTSNKPGGQGGDDIWVADLDGNGDATNAVNLGATINTPMDEQAAYYDPAKKRLIYSSKGFTGLGGFDFFESWGDVGQWSEPVNMGYPINSAKDDLYFLPDDADPRKFYISSDRQSDCCLNLLEAHNDKFTLAGTVSDCDKHTPLEGVKVTFIDSLAGKKLASVETGKDGKYSFQIATKRPYNLRLEKANYFAKVVPVPMSGDMRHDTLHSPDICLQSFKIDSPIVIKNIWYDFNKATLRPASRIELDHVAKIMKDNPTFKIEMASHTDSVGGNKFNLRLSQKRAQACVDYLIAGGISKDRLIAHGYGKTKPIAPNSLPNGKDNPAGRQLNRRTEFTVLKTE